MKIVIDIPQGLYANLQKIQNGSIASKRILDLVRSGTPLPKGATNGDVFQATFPNIDFKIDNEENVVDVKLGGFTEYAPIDLTWWNAPYKAGE